MFRHFILLKDLSKDQLNIILSQNDLYSKVTPADIGILPKVNVNNFVNICNFVDYYQLIPYNEFLDNIRYHILIKTPQIIDNINKLPYSMQHTIYDHECIPNIKCKYENPYDCEIKHICCYKFLNQNKKLAYNIDHASGNGNLELVKYLFKIKKRCTTNAILNAILGRHLEVVKYLFEVKHKDCTQYGINWASHLDNLEVVKYLIEVQNKKYTQTTINGASKRVLAYLLTKPDSFIQ